jgi:uncharacterized protein YhbP (UPF0306 family)
MTRTDNSAHAWTVLNDTTYAVLATADADGTPWATPVWFAHDHLDRLYWLSWPESRHSQLIEQRSEIALTVFDTTAAPNEGTGFYATAQAHQCPDGHVDAALSVLNRRLLTQGLSELTRENVTGQSRLRPYVAEIDEAWVLDQDAGVDRRAPVPRPPFPH